MNIFFASSCFFLFLIVYSPHISAMNLNFLFPIYSLSGNTFKASLALIAIIFQSTFVNNNKLNSEIGNMTKLI